MRQSFKLQYKVKVGELVTNKGYQFAQNVTKLRKTQLEGFKRRYQTNR